MGADNCCALARDDIVSLCERICELLCVICDVSDVEGGSRTTRDATPHRLPLCTIAHPGGMLSGNERRPGGLQRYNWPLARRRGHRPALGPDANGRPSRKISISRPEMSGRVRCYSDV